MGERVIQGPGVVKRGWRRGEGRRVGVRNGRGGWKELGECEGGSRIFGGVKERKGVGAAVGMGGRVGEGM